MKKQIKFVIAALVISTSLAAVAQQSEMALNLEGKIEATEIDSNIAAARKKIQELVSMEDILGDSGQSGNVLGDMGKVITMEDERLADVIQTGDIQASRVLLRDLDSRINHFNGKIQDLLNN